MKLLITLVLVFNSFLIYAQENMIKESITDSIKWEPSYKLIDSTRTLDYSGNWDFDNDLITDKLYLIGNDGAHTYYHLRIELSSNNKIYEYDYLSIDFPYIGKLENLTTHSFFPSPHYPQFIVEDFDSDARFEIYIKLDRPTFLVFEKELESLGIYSSYILIDFNMREPNIQNFIK